MLFSNWAGTKRNSYLAVYQGTSYNIYLHTIVFKNSNKFFRRFTLPDDELCIDLQFGLRSTVFLTSRHLLVIGSPKLLQSLHTKLSKFTDIVHYNGVEYMRLSQVVDHLSVGQNHISFVTQAAQNIVQSCGDARYGLGSDVSLWSEESRIRKLVSGWTHCGALNDNGEVQLWGRNNYAQLGNLFWNRISIADMIFIVFHGTKNCLT